MLSGARYPDPPRDTRCPGIVRRPAHPADPV